MRFSSFVKQPAPCEPRSLPAAPATTALPLGTDVDPADDAEACESGPTSAAPAPAPSAAAGDASPPTEQGSPGPESFEGTPLKRAVIRLSRVSDPALSKVRRQLGMDGTDAPPPVTQNGGSPTAGEGETDPGETPAETEMETEPATASAGETQATAAAAVGQAPPPESEELFVSPERTEEVSASAAGSVPTPASIPAPAPTPASPAARAPALAASSRAARLVGLAQKRQAPADEPAASPERPAPQPPPTPSTPVHHR